MFSRYHVNTRYAVACLTLMTMVGAPALAQSGGGKSPAKEQTPPKVKQRPGGANQVEGMNGKVGDMLFDGRWRFQLQEVKEVPTYTLTVPSSEQDYAHYHTAAEYDVTTKVFTPKAGYTLVALKCLIKNGQNKVQQLDCYSLGINTAIADDQGNSHPPIAYDMMSSGAWTSKPLLPGSGQAMTILFAVPPGTKLKDLVFSVKNWSDKKINTLRISLGGAGTAAPAGAASTPATTP
jgi:hypothetical protein